jgi:hypothetical protein
MSEYELVDLALSSLGHLGTSAPYCTTMIFGYLVAAHMIGDKLPQGVLWFLTFVYTTALISPLYGLRAGIGAYNNTVREYVSSYPDGSGFIRSASSMISAPVEYLTFLPILLSWLGSVVFMHLYMRRRRTEATQE